MWWTGHHKLGFFGRRKEVLGVGGWFSLKLCAVVVHTDSRCSACLADRFFLIPYFKRFCGIYFSMGMLISNFICSKHTDDTHSPLSSRRTLFRQLGPFKVKCRTIPTLISFVWMDLLSLYSIEAKFRHTSLTECVKNVKKTAFLVKYPVNLPYSFIKLMICLNFSPYLSS